VSIGPIQDEEILDVGGGKVKSGTLPFTALTSDVQRGRTSVTFGFAAAGEENVSASITFPTAFAAAPVVVASIEGIDAGIVNISVTTTGFTITVRDDKGTDYTTSQTATVNWIAIVAP